MIGKLTLERCTKLDASLVIISYIENIHISNDEMLVFAENVIEMEIEILILSKKKRRE